MATELYAFPSFSSLILCVHLGHHAAKQSYMSSGNKSSLKNPPSFLLDPSQNPGNPIFFIRQIKLKRDWIALSVPNPKPSTIKCV